MIRIGALLFALCGAIAQAKVTKVDDSFNGREIALHPGDILEIELAENATTGFQWFLKTKPDFLPEFQNTEPDQRVVPGPPGKGGVHRFYLRAERPGSGDLNVEYRRSWEKDKAPARTYKLHVRVGA